MLTNYFQETHYTSIAQVIRTRKVFTDKQILSQIANCVCKEISKNIQERKSLIVTHHEFEVFGSKVRETILQNIEPYDENQKFVAKMKQTLIASFEPNDEHIDFETSGVLREPENRVSEHESTARRQPKPTVECDVYCTRAMRILQELNQAYENFVNHPETHPNYIREWKQFYAENKLKVWDNDYQLDWKQHFSRRLVELKRADLDQRLAQLNWELPANGQRRATNRTFHNNSALMEQNFNVIDVTGDEEEVPSKRQRLLFSSPAQEDSSTHLVTQHVEDEDCILVEPIIDLIELSDNDEDEILI